MTFVKFNINDLISLCSFSMIVLSLKNNYSNLILMTYSIVFLRRSFYNMGLLNNYFLEKLCECYLIDIGSPYLIVLSKNYNLWEPICKKQKLYYSFNLRILLSISRENFLFLIANLILRVCFLFFLKLLKSSASPLFSFILLS